MSIFVAAPAFLAVAVTEAKHTHQGPASQRRRQTTGRREQRPFFLEECTQCHTHGNKARTFFHENKNKEDDDEKEIQENNKLMAQGLGRHERKYKKEEGTVDKAKRK